MASTYQRRKRTAEVQRPLLQRSYGFMERQDFWKASVLMEPIGLLTR